LRKRLFACASSGYSTPGGIVSEGRFQNLLDRELRQVRMAMSPNVPDTKPGDEEADRKLQAAKAAKFARRRAAAKKAAETRRKKTDQPPKKNR
jgi:hypothetical protein